MMIPCCLFVGYVFGGDVLRVFHGDECLTIPPRETENVHGWEQILNLWQYNIIYQKQHFLVYNIFFIIFVCHL